jgi:tetratricopeptide (TPR) repeat protein
MMNKHKIYLGFSILCLFTSCTFYRANSYNYKGYDCLEREDFEGAKQNFGEAVRLMPEISNFHNNLATVCIKSGDMETAWYHIRQAVLLDPKNPEAIKRFYAMWDYLKNKKDIKIGIAMEDLILAFGLPDLESRVENSTKTDLIYGMIIFQFNNHILVGYKRLDAHVIGHGDA